MMTPAQFAQQLETLAAQYTRIGIFKFFNTCCEACLAKAPLFLIQSDLQYKDVVMAHGLSMQGVYTTVRKLFADDKDAALTLAQIEKSVRQGAVSPDVSEFAKKLSNVYNTLHSMDNGTTLHIVARDSKVFRVALQGLVFVNPNHARRDGVTKT